MCSSGVVISSQLVDSSICFVVRPQFLPPNVRPSEKRHQPGTRHSISVRTPGTLVSATKMTLPSLIQTNDKVVSHSEVSPLPFSRNRIRLEHSALEHSALEQSALEQSALEHSALEHSALEHSALEHSALEHSAPEINGGTIEVTVLLCHVMRVEAKRVVVDWRCVVPFSD
jgi:hypothetical protein